VLREISREEYSVRITWLIWGRAVLTTFLVGTLLFFQQRYRIYSFHAAVLYYVLFSVYALTALYRYLQARFNNPLFLAWLQTSVDILLVTYLVFLTGGIDSGLSILYHLAIISASIILYRRGGYLAASLSSILYGAMLDIQYYNALGLVRSHNFTAGQVLYEVFINLISFYVVALLSGYLAERLRATRLELRDKSIDFEDLRVLQDHILRSVGSGILTLDLQGSLTSWNPAAEQITGYPYDEARQRWQEIFGDSFQELFSRADSLRQRPLRFNGQIVKKDGARAVLGMTASLLKDDSNAVRGTILTFQDITKLVEMEEQIRRQERLATVGSLAAGIAHEIRNPLASLSGSIQVLQSELTLKDDDKRLMDIVVRETDRLNGIITDFLEYARPKPAQTERVDLRLLLDETIALLANSRPSGADIRIAATEVAARLELKGDARRLRQVFWNLLINSCQAMPEGGAVRISAQRASRAEFEVQNSGAQTPIRETPNPGPDAGFLEISVADTGPGIPREHLDRIFDPFFTTKTGGTGLGLAIAYRIVEDHQGTISAVSEPGMGARFVIRLPLSGDAGREGGATA
jgi:two-component system sensor histidine kinase PilS (NtrC family)